MLLSNQAGALLLGLFACGVEAAANGDVLYVQAPTASATTVTSAYMSPDGSDMDEFAWDGFLLPAAGNISEVRWRGAGGGNIVSFEVSIYASIPAGTQPDLGYLYPGPLVHYTLQGNAGETFAGTAGGVNFYDYHFTLPRAFVAAANTRYWLRIVAWQAGWPVWGFATASGGNGSHFARVPAGVGDYRYIIGPNDMAFTLNGTWAACSVPSITQNPEPVAGCANSTTAIFSAAATGAGPLSYRWRLNGNPVYDGPNGGGHGGGAQISGATTSTLIISNASYWADVGVYDCMISNGCGPSYTTGALLSVTFGGPTITASPASVSACIGDVANFAVSTGTNGPLAFSWTRDGVVLDDGVTPWGSQVSGAGTGAMQISGAALEDAGTYVCTVTNPCGSAASADAVLSVRDCSFCPADFNQDGGVDGGDVEAFFVAWQSGDASSDVNLDGGIDGADVETFFRAWEAGGC